MTSKDKVKEIYPRAYTEKHQTKNPLRKEYYYLIWSSRLREEKVRLGEGSTEAKAWKDALEWIEEIGEKDLKTEEK